MPKPSPSIPDPVGRCIDRKAAILAKMPPGLRRATADMIGAWEADRAERAEHATAGRDDDLDDDLDDDRDQEQ